MESNLNTTSSATPARGDKDPRLWKIAQKRATFKYHALIYFIINIFFWTLWYIKLRDTNDIHIPPSSIPWPVWPMFGWGIGLVFHYLSTYRNNDSLAEKEYEKLRNKQ